MATRRKTAKRPKARKTAARKRTSPRGKMGCSCC